MGVALLIIFELHFQNQATNDLFLHKQHMEKIQVQRMQAMANGLVHTNVQRGDKKEKCQHSFVLPASCLGTFNIFAAIFFS